MRSVGEISRERSPILTGEERAYAAIAELLEAGADALRRGPVCGVCTYGACVRPSTKDSDRCRIHEGLA